MEWAASTLHTTSEHGVSSITTADAHTSAASSRLNWRPSRFKWTRPFRRETKSGFIACAITFQPASTYSHACNCGMMGSRVYRCLTRGDFTWCSHSLRINYSIVQFTHTSYSPSLYNFSMFTKVAHILFLFSCIVPSLQKTRYSYKALPNADVSGRAV